MARARGRQNLRVSPTALESLYRVSQQLREDAKLWGGPRMRPDIIAIDLALGLSDEYVAQRHGLPREFITEFRRMNRELVLQLQQDSYQAHMLVRVLVSMKAAFYLDAVVSGELQGDPERVNAARALLVPVPLVIVDSPNPILQMMGDMLRRGEQRAMEMEPPEVPSLEEFLARSKSDGSDSE